MTRVSCYNCCCHFLTADLPVGPVYCPTCRPPPPPKPPPKLKHTPKPTEESKR